MTIIFSFINLIILVALVLLAIVYRKKKKEYSDFLKQMSKQHLDGSQEEKVERLSAFLTKQDENAEYDLLKKNPEFLLQNIVMKETFIEEGVRIRVQTQDEYASSIKNTQILESTMRLGILNKSSNVYPSNFTNNITQMDGERFDLTDSKSVLRNEESP